jgi:tripartite ATP-independent transporter DctM subunit
MQWSYIIPLLILLGTMVTYMPVFMCLFYTALICVLAFTDYPVILLVQSIFKSMDNFALVVVLFFILCGNIMTTGTIVEKLIKFTNVLVSWLPGGLGMAGVIACAIFGAISGSTVATVVALGGFMIPALLANGYEEHYSIGLMTTSGNLGVIIPPSIGMILFSMISNCSLQGLFLTGFVPGVLITLGTCIYTYFIFRKDEKVVRMPVPTLNDFWVTFKDCFWALMLPGVIFIGIYSGMFTANEAAVVSCVYAFIVELFIHKSMKFDQVKKVVVGSAVTSASLLIIVGGATCFGRYLALESIPAKITEAVTAGIHSPIVFLLIMNVVLLVVGTLMDIISATLIIGPICIPLLIAFGIDPIHFGLIMTVNLAIGYCTPPVGVSLYIAGSVANRDIVYVTKSVMPFLVIQTAILLLITFFPEMVMWLPKLFGFETGVMSVGGGN